MQNTRRDASSSAMLEMVAWHDKLSSLHILNKDLELASRHEAEAERQEVIYNDNLDRWKRSKGQDVASKNRAERAAKAVIRERRLAYAAKTDMDPVAHVSHTLVAAQLRAVASGGDATKAVVSAVDLLAHHSNAEIVKAAEAHPNFRLLAKTANSIH